MVKPIPDHFRTVTPRLAVPGTDAIGFYERAFGAEQLGDVFSGPEGELIHVAIRIGDSVVMLTGESDLARAPGGGPVTAIMATYWEDVDAAWERALAAGAEVLYPARGPVLRRARRPRARPVRAPLDAQPGHRGRLPRGDGTTSPGALLMNDAYPVQYAVDYPDRDLNRVSTALPHLHGDPDPDPDRDHHRLPDRVRHRRDDHHGRGHRNRAAVRAARPDDHLPREVPALVVRLEPRADALQQPRRRLLRADGRPLSVDRRPPGRAPRLRATRTPGPT